MAGIILAGPDFAGTWRGKTEVPDQGRDDIVLVLEKTEDGYRGTVTDSLELIAHETVLLDIKVEGNGLSFRFPLVDDSMVVIKLTVEGDKMTGTWEHSGGDRGLLEFERSK
jgi:hypothetical protein